MIGFVCGASGSGKSEWVYARMAEAAESGPVFLLVPDREAVAAESRTAELSGVGNIDVVTFRRLCNYIFRRYGGLCADYIGPGAKKLVMYRVLTALSPALSEYGGAHGFGFVGKLTEARSEMYQNKITPGELARVSDMLDSDLPVRAKAADLGVIFAAFDREVAARWEDPDGILSKAAALLRENDFFAGCTVFIDSFTSFSAQQYDLISLMMAGAEHVYITLPYLPGDDGDAAELIADTARRLKRAAQRAGRPDVQEISLRGVKRYQSDELAFLSEHIDDAASARAIFWGTPRNIRLVRAVNVFAEAEAAALDISRRVRGGARYREMAVIVRDAAAAQGIVDAVFRKYEIPYFLSDRVEISEKPLVKLIFSALSTCERGFRGEDVISYIKTGLTGITPDEGNLLENYIVKWNLHGKKLYGDDEWNMSPAGYSSSLAKADIEALSRLSHIRRRVFSPLKAFSAALREAKTVKMYATLLFDFLSDLGVPEALKEKTEAAHAREDFSAAAETVQLWNVFCSALDQLVVSCGDMEVPASEFSQMLQMILFETDIGKIPTSVDEVTIFSASQAVPGHPKYVYLLGVNEGIFPQRVGENGFFSEYEKGLLEKQGVVFADRAERRVMEESYYFCRAASLASDALFVSFSHYSLSGTEERESVGVKRIRALFPALVTDDFELSERLDLIEGRTASFERALSYSGNLGRALREYYEKDPVFAEKLKYAKLPLSAQSSRLTPACAEELFGGRLTTSYSRLEAYIKCRFSYFCTYELKLQDSLPAGYEAVDIGNFVHMVLEKTVKWIAQGGDGDIEERAKDAAREYILSVFHEEPSALSGRFRHLFDALVRNAVRFAARFRKEFEVSEFQPCDFELVIGKGEDAVLPMHLESENVSVDLRGKIDRVDIYLNGDGKLYVRVVDYKTGSKTFDIQNVKLGLDIQMLLYLFSLWENGEIRYGKPVVPAGVLYVGVNPEAVERSTEDKDGDVQEKMQASGLFLDNEQILRAMDPALEGEFIPVKAKGNGKGKNLIGLEALSDLKREVTQTVLRYASEMKRGLADARPLVTKDINPCQYCKMRPVCRTGRSKIDE